MKRDEIMDETAILERLELWILMIDAWFYEPDLSPSWYYGRKSYSHRTPSILTTHVVPSSQVNYFAHTAEI